MSSCGKETQSTAQGGGVFKVKVTVNPPLQKGIGLSPSEYNSAGVSIAGFLNTGWSGNTNNADLSNFTTEEIAVTNGQNLSVYVYVSNFKDLNCRDVKIEGIQNGKVIKTYNYSMGYKSLLPTPNLCLDGNAVQNNFIIN